MGPPAPSMVGRYAIYDRIAAGGMASVHLGRLMGEAGFARTVAIKKMHAHYALEPEFVAMFLDEARLAARVRHPNVVPTLDVVAQDGELFLVMEYVDGESLGRLVKATAERGEKPTPAIAVAILAGALQGLEAAHEAKSDRGEPLGIVHRDFNPQNVLVGADGVARVLDFGVAKALGQSHATRTGQLKGKLSYMAPEQMILGEATRQSDIFSAGAMLWEALTAKRLFAASNDGMTIHNVTRLEVVPPSQVASDITPGLDRVVLRALARDPKERFATAAEMAEALEAAVEPATTREVARWVRGLLGATLEARRARVAQIEEVSASMPAAAAPEAVPVSDGALEEPVPPSQASSVALETPTERRRAQRRPLRVTFATLALVAAIALGFVLSSVLHGTREAPTAASPPPQALTVPAPTPVVSSPAADSAAPAETTSAAPSALASASPPAPSSSPKARRAPPTRPPPAPYNPLGHL